MSGQRCVNQGALDEKQCKKFSADGKLLHGLASVYWERTYNICHASGDDEADEESDDCWAWSCFAEFSEVSYEACRKAGFVWGSTTCYDSVSDIPKEECRNKENAYWGKKTAKCYPSPKARDSAERSGDGSQKSGK